MKYFFIVFIFASFPFSVFCQDGDSTKPKKFLIGFTFSPDYSYRVLKDAKGSYNYIIKYRDSTEVPKFGFTSGFNFGYIINKKLMLEAGLLFSDKGENTIRETNFRPISPQSFIPEYASYKYHYFYIDIPIKANYFLVKKRAKFFLSAGISSNIFLKEKMKAILEFKDGKTKEEIYARQNGFSRLNFAVVAGFGFGYDISERLYFKIEPQYRHSINSTVKKDFGPIKNYLYSYGLNTGLYLRF